MSMANMTKVQPGLEAETAVIGALLISPEIVKDVLFTVREQDFRIEINRQILYNFAYLRIVLRFCPCTE